MIIIDSDIVIDVLRKHRPALTWMNAQPSAVLISGFSAIEVFAGCRDTAQQRSVDAMLKGLRVVWPSTARCNFALNNFRSLRLSHGIGALDTLIAQTAIELNLALHTFNVKHFQHILGLQTIQPYTR